MWRARERPQPRGDGKENGETYERGEDYHEDGVAMFDGLCRDYGGCGDIPLPGAKPHHGARSGSASAQEIASEERDKDEERRCEDGPEGDVEDMRNVRSDREKYDADERDARGSDHEGPQPLGEGEMCCPQSDAREDGKEHGEDERGADG